MGRGYIIEAIDDSGKSSWIERCDYERQAMRRVGSLNAAAPRIQARIDGAAPRRGRGRPPRAGD